MDKEIKDLKKHMVSLDKEISKMDNAKQPKSQPNYEHWFDSINSNKKFYKQIKKNIASTTNKAIELNDHLNAIIEKLNSVASAINNNKMKFGLRGQLKKTIESHDPEIELTMEQQHALEQPYAQTPSQTSYIPSSPYFKGGKRKTRSLRRRG